jgi:hypothetical protein
LDPGGGFGLRGVTTVGLTTLGETTVGETTVGVTTVGRGPVKTGSTTVPGSGIVGLGSSGPGITSRCTVTTATSALLRLPALSVTSSWKRCEPTGSPASTVIVDVLVVIGWPTLKVAMRSQPITVLGPK